ncbi:hypothetical protein, partial [Frankia sp. AgKG'84/4]|uniref:hypothetical protein n=1 Tax=Frankia sp. AgKG'84/4 TaxID=573490 RepID=UPI00202AA96B
PAAPGGTVTSRGRRPGAPPASGTSAGLFDVMFAYHPRVLDGLTLTGLGTEELRGHEGPVGVPLTLAVEDDADVVCVLAAVDATLFTAADAERFAGRFARLAEQAADDAVLGELDAMSTTERHLVVDEWTSGRTDPLAERPLAALVADQTRRTPDAVAVVAVSAAVAAAPHGPAGAADGSPDDAVTLTYTE